MIWLRHHIVTNDKWYLCRWWASTRMYQGNNKGKINAYFRLADESPVKGDRGRRMRNSPPRPEYVDDNTTPLDCVTYKQVRYRDNFEIKTWYSYSPHMTSLLVSPTKKTAI